MITAKEANQRTKDFGTSLLLVAELAITSACTKGVYNASMLFSAAIDPTIVSTLVDTLKNRGYTVFGPFKDAKYNNIDIVWSIVND
jgi:hypothetical protein